MCRAGWLPSAGYSERTRVPSEERHKPHPQWSEAEDRLRDALRSFAESVDVPIDAYRPVSGRWLRESHNRKIIAASPVLLVVLLAAVLAIYGHPDLPRRPVEYVMQTFSDEGTAIRPSRSRPG